MLLLSSGNVHLCLITVTMDLNAMENQKYVGLYSKYRLRQGITQNSKKAQIYILLDNPGGGHVSTNKYFIKSRD